MKRLVLLIFLLTLFSIKYLQAQHFKISYGIKSVSVNIDEENIDKMLTLNLHDPNNKEFLVENLLAEEEKEWVRKFLIYDSLDTEIVALKKTGASVYCLPEKTIKATLSPGNKYFLYTIALPADPEKAMTIRVRRQLLTGISVESRN